MFEKQNIQEIINRLRRLFKILAPDNDSVSVARDLWAEWQKSGIAPPDISEIAKDYAAHENGFFFEMVRLAEKMQQEPLSIEFCQFTLDKYNAYAITARDGYVVLIDDVFFQILYFICNVLVFDAMGEIEDPSEKEEAKHLVSRIIQTNYFSRQRIDFGQEGIQHRLLKRNYELAEFANYFFAACKAFILAHEIGHHVLGHARGVASRTFALNGKEVAVEVDERAIADEYAADQYGYRLFDLLSNTNDETVYYAWCKYKFAFAPLFLFDLFHWLDKTQERQFNTPITYATHPHPLSRLHALQDSFPIDTVDPLYVLLKRSLSTYFNPS